ncbi:MAG: glutamine-hydrolyzing carbamoyl-phosphate synthase small subunit [Bacillota bacterium]|nr:glutamine-hydrolyzing carbamoyl-phosphate synthase small subunit [Bacillota bacterium]
MKGYLILEDGTVFHGDVFGKEGATGGEVVFTTGMTGYQEVLTDPSYCGQIVTFTYPLIGNYGINHCDFEALSPSLAGIVVSELCQEPSNWQSKISLAEYLRLNNLTGIQGIDTRMLTKILRAKGTIGGKIVVCEDELARLQANPKQLQPSLTTQVAQVTTAKPYFIPGGPETIVVLDCGAKGSIMECLVNMGYSTLVVPATTSWEEILAYDPVGVMLSNGPGNPQNVLEICNTIKNLLGKVPIMGVCLGHQLLGLTFGMNTFKLPFGHRGGNHPVKEITTGKVMITSQNHGYVLDKDTLPDEIEITHVSLNDNTIEGIRHKYLPAFSVQFHPEAAPGPKDAGFIYKRFQELINNFQHKSRRGVS